jgi:hypothetical protein
MPGGGARQGEQDQREHGRDNPPGPAHPPAHPCGPRHSAPCPPAARAIPGARTIPDRLPASSTGQGGVSHHGKVKDESAPDMGRSSPVPAGGTAGTVAQPDSLGQSFVPDNGKVAVPCMT